MTESTPLQRLMGELDHELGNLLPVTKARIRKQLIAAYWMGARDTLDIDNNQLSEYIDPAAERRSTPREPIADTSLAWPRLTR